MTDMRKFETRQDLLGFLIATLQYPLPRRMVWWDGRMAWSKAIAKDKWFEQWKAKMPKDNWE